MLQTVIQHYLPIILYFTLHYSFANKLSKRKYLLPALCTLAIFWAYTIFCYYYFGGEWNKSNILTLLPSSYLTYTIGLRYLLFNSYLKRYLYQYKNSPYDPTIIYSGIYTIYWDDKSIKPYFIEHFYSFGIMLLPWTTFLLV